MKENAPFTVFDDWSSILEQVQQIVGGKITVQEAAEQGYEQYKKSAAGANGSAK